VAEHGVDRAEGGQKGEAWAKAAIWGNIPSNLKAQFGSVGNVTSAQLMGLWHQKLEGVSGDLASLQAPYAGAVARGVQDELIKASRAAWPHFKSLIDRMAQPEHVDPAALVADGRRDVHG
jgi:hypothetical protein